MISRLGGQDLSQQYQSDEALAQALLQQRQQAQQLQQAAQYGQQVMPHWSEFQRYLAERQQAAQQPKQDKPWWSEWWNPPEFDQRWLQQVTRDAQGNLVAAQGAPPDVVNKLSQYQDFRAAQAERLMSNPFEFFEQPIKTLAQQVAQQAIQQQMAQHQDQLFAREVAQRNAAWLYQRDAAGSIVTEQTFNAQTGQMVAQPVLSQHGQAFRNYVIEAGNLGITSLQGQERYAMKMLNADWSQSQATQGTAAAQGQVAKQQFLAGAQHQPNHGGSQSPPNLNGTAPSQNQSLSLGERMRKRLHDAGVTDRDFAAVR